MTARLCRTTKRHARAPRRTIIKRELHPPERRVTSRRVRIGKHRVFTICPTQVVHFFFFRGIAFRYSIFRRIPRSKLDIPLAHASANEQTR